MVHTLALFSWESERACSRQVVDGRHWPYAHDLNIQGVLKVSAVFFCIHFGSVTGLTGADRTPKLRVRAES